MARNPWTDPDPKPDDFDSDLEAINTRYVEAHAGNPDAKLTIVVGAEDEDAERLSSSPPAAKSARPKSSQICSTVPDQRGGEGV